MAKLHPTANSTLFDTDIKCSFLGFRHAQHPTLTYFVQCLNTILEEIRSSRRDHVARHVTATASRSGSRVSAALSSSGARPRVCPRTCTSQIKKPTRRRPPVGLVMAPELGKAGRHVLDGRERQKASVTAWRRQLLFL